MKRSNSPKINAPYQPLLLRITHNLHGVFVLMALVTALWTYSTYDGRWGKFFLPDWPQIEGIHGTFGLWALLIFPLFVIYVIHRGNKKLLQENSWQKLKLVNKPIWYYTIHRLVNTLSLFALSFAFFSGKMMDEKWLPQGELNHWWYYLHLASWLLVIFMLTIHLLMNAKIGGIDLFLSMLNFDYRQKDNPQQWIDQIKTYRSQWKLFIREEWQKLPVIFKRLEVIIILLLALSWLISFLK